MTTLTRSTTLLAATLALVCGSRAARAQFVMTLPAAPLVIDAANGGTATFTATLTNNNAYALYLNSDTFTLFSPATLDDTLFQTYFVTPPNNAPQPMLAANGGTITLSLFTISLPAGLTPGSLYSGTITLQGGADPFASDNLDTEQFAARAVTPAAPPPAVPEPGSMALLAGLSAAGVGWTARRKSGTTRK